VYGGLYFIKMLTWKFIHSFACVDSDMDKAKLSLSFDVVQKRNGGADRRLTYDLKITIIAWFKGHMAAHERSCLDDLVYFFIIHL
jgi:hypothetical protein